MFKPRDYENAGYPAVDHLHISPIMHLDYRPSYRYFQLKVARILASNQGALWDMYKIPQMVSFFYAEPYKCCNNLAKHAINVMSWLGWFRYRQRVYMTFVHTIGDVANSKRPPLIIPKVQLCLRVTRRSATALVRYPQKFGKKILWVKNLVTAQMQLCLYSEQQRVFGVSNICTVYTQ